MSEAPTNQLEISEESRLHAQEIYDKLESQSWAPWLRFTAEELACQAAVFPEGQIELNDQDGRPVAAVSANRIEWDGDPAGVGSWDDVAGDTFTYAETFKRDGNTLILMSMSVDSAHKGRGVAGEVIEKLREYAQSQELEHIIGHFRPKDFGEYKRRTGECNFEDYCNSSREDGLPVDGWLRAVTRQGMQPVRIEERAMVVDVPLDELEVYRRDYNPEQWWQVNEPAQIEYLQAHHKPHMDLENIDEVWECGETGTWYVDSANKKAVYVESNYLGELPFVDGRAPHQANLTEG